jgi:UDP-N-acetylmuramate dehydrogenase
MQIYNNYSLKKLNAFKHDIKAKYFFKINNLEDINNILTNKNLKYNGIYILGDGTNTLFSKDYDGLIIKNYIKNIKIINQTSKEVHLEVDAGVNWHKLVYFAVRNNWGALENMAMIPGTVGAAPVQNIAAYGQCFDDVFISLKAINLINANKKTFNKKSCKFRYRESIFKTKLKDQFIITSVRLKLSKSNKINTSYYSRYGSLEDELVKSSKPPYSLRDIFNAVIRIRKSKFPDPKKYGTAGSFFLNPTISKNQLSQLQKIAPRVQFYPVEGLSYPKQDDLSLKNSDKVKVAAGWLFEEIGWKGKRIGNVGTSPNQSLVIVSYKNSTPQEVINFAKKMKKDFKKHFNIDLEFEVNIR